jgi:23S rRNA (adenine2503-C2)-methyltransferase
MPRHLLDLTSEELDHLFANWDEPRYRARQVSRWALFRGVTTFEAMTDVAAPLRERLAAEFTLAAPPVLTSTVADDGDTTKVLLDLGDGASVETVRMRYDPDEPGIRGRQTVCVSTQVGCAMKCVFCATGQQGFTRNLTPAEILAQVLYFAREDRVTNVVFMGMGEPLANTSATLAAVRWMASADGMDLRARGITVSTVGLRTGIRRLAAEHLQVGLTISLHAPDDELRHRLIPTSAGTTITDLVEAARDYIATTGRRVTFAYALLDGVNDNPEQAALLAKRIRGIQAHVNLIPYNPTAGPGLRRPSSDRVHAFQHALQEAGINATVRAERGVEIAAACGQLRTDFTQKQDIALV